MTGWESSTQGNNSLSSSTFPMECCFEVTTFHDIYGSNTAFWSFPSMAKTRLTVKTVARLGKIKHS